jgi:predicted transcriptional regulator
MGIVTFFSSPKTAVSKYIESKKKKEADTSYKVKRETILFVLDDEGTSEQSIQMYEDISSAFKLKMSQRLDRVTWEKRAIEEFFNK